ncbi:glycosyltransferase family 2 protein [Candidatus Contendibacter odensensis]|jgi:GT2 family glycosyltransferase|uniref:Predicted glycosyltransferase n=1 Tax=Candidatus Contendobacter odensis Run_B_J11 TaxID=1400861 RepID=A0A7U7G7P0_9GAMM|nr:glycosyltransferase family 2 protein [Candidatus Contendobacter odensis]MBK8750467.1 glycosyltransferase family 2 protein [Candidatus Competibacteraceae bacterium]CDH43437.1 Predicted glycosyltransferase [Candidatus Contendobacter odensis Run_B_J11]
MAGIAVIIVNFNSGPLLGQCLRHLRAQTHRPQRVMVVDNASHDGSTDGIERDYPEVEWVRLERNLGFAAANNLAAQRADGVEWLALLNPDAFPKPDWLERLLAATLAHPGCTSFGSRLLDAGDPGRLDGTGDIYHVSGLAWRRDHGQIMVAGASADGEIFAPCAAAALYRRSTFLEVGGFDQDYFCYFEDIDLGFRLRLLGYHCRYVPDAVVLHVGSAVTGRRSSFSLYHGHRNLVWTYCKNMPALLFWIYLPQHLLLNLGTVAWFALRGQGIILLRAKWDALRGLPRCWRQRRVIQASRRISSWSLRQMMSHGLWALCRRGGA